MKQLSIIFLFLIISCKPEGDYKNEDYNEVKEIVFCFDKINAVAIPISNDGSDTQIYRLFLAVDFIDIEEDFKKLKIEFLKQPNLNAELYYNNKDGFNYLKVNKGKNLYADSIIMIYRFGNSNDSDIYELPKTLVID